MNPYVGQLVNATQLGLHGEVVEVLAGSVGVRITDKDSPLYRTVVHVNAGHLVADEREAR